MSSSWGRQVIYSLFGESHGAGIGITVHRLPAGFRPDFDRIQRELDRRKPGTGIHATPRREEDAYKILSGLYEDRLTGAPLTVFFPNTDTRSDDYTDHSAAPRPSHADYAAGIKYSGYQDFRGGGHFSGRLTAPVVFAGALAAQLLEPLGVSIGARICRMGPVADEPEALSGSDIRRIAGGGLKDRSLPFLSERAQAEAASMLQGLREAGDSVGGQIELVADGMTAGWGEPFFDSLESTLGHLIFSIPGVKALEFGAGTAFGNMKGSQANDPWTLQEGSVSSDTNNSGGINGGISNGMPLLARVTFRPTPSISVPQGTVNLKEGCETVLEIKGRHDPCIVPRACPVVEAATAMALLEAMLEHQIQMQEAWK